MATPSQLRLLEQLLAASFSPAQLYQLLYGLFGLSFVGSLPPHQFVPPAHYFFEVVQRLEMNGYLLNNKMGQAFFSALVQERPGRANESAALAVQFGVSISITVTTAGGAAPAPISPLQFTLRVVPQHITASWDNDGKSLSGENDLPDSFPAVDDAQAQVWALTASGRTAEIARAVDTLSYALTKALLLPNIQAQLTAVQNAAVQQKRPLEIRLDFASSEQHAHYSWELLREPSQRARPLSTIPNVFITRPFASDTLLTPVVPGEKKLLLVLGEAKGRPELERVKALWDEKGLLVTTLNMPKEPELSRALRDGPWDVVHLITHGDREKVFLGETLDAEQLGNMISGHVRTACLLSVCNSGLRTLETGERPGALLWRGVAQRLIASGVPNVLAWSNLAYIDDCARATPIWHEQYLKGKDPRIATYEARQELFGVKERSYGWLVHFTA